MISGGCFFKLDCAEDETCAPVGTDGGPPPGCIPSMATGAVADTCGVFVSPSGDDGNAGTKEKPLKTITVALGKGTTVYACAGAMPYPEALTVSTEVAIYGALDCSSWVYRAATKTQLASAADAVALTVMSTAGGTEVHDFIITAADASVPGGSSIAVLVDQASALFQNVDVNAGSGATGAAGMEQAQVMTPATAKGSDGTDDPMCNVPGSIGGGLGGKNMCGGTDTSGGGGGTGFAATAGGPGGGGNPMVTSNGGSGQTTTVACNASDPKGDAGSTGTPGTGARGAGSVSDSGYQGPMGTPGTPGTPGQGGGGGGGALACDSPTDMFAGPSGGGGGAGGCPGMPGNAGQSGGSSIGILALGAKVTLTTVSIRTKTGGAGGTGGDGQQGGPGGSPGQAPASTNACDGGKGGQGGAGGPGGGGAGGHSIALAIKGGTLPDLSGTTIVSGTGGTGGPGGDMDMTMQTKGDDGMACRTLDFTTPASPVCGM
jgi:hypothetical protein